MRILRLRVRDTGFMNRDSSEIILMHSASLMIFRGVERWLLEVARRLSIEGCKIAIVTFSLRLDEYGSAKLLERYRAVKEYLRGSRRIVWHELKALSFRYSSKILSPIAKLLDKQGIFMPHPLEVYELAKILRGSRVIYIATGSVFQALAMCLLVVLLGGRKIVIGFHSRPSYKWFLYTRRFFENLASIGVLKGIHTINIADYIVISKALRSTKVFFIPNGVDCEKFHADISRKRKDFFQVLFVGALSYGKGVDTVLRVAELLKTRYPETKINIVIASTGGPLESEVVKAAKRGLCEYRGFVDDITLVKLYEESHVALFPSREEAFGLVALEAQASGTPVICSNAIGFKHTIRDGFSGIVVGDYKDESFSNAIMHIYKLYREGHRYEEMCINARRNAERFCWDKVMTELRALFTI